MPDIVLPDGPLMATYAAPPVQFVSGQGSELFDASGKRYLDFLGVGSPGTELEFAL